MIAARPYVYIGAAGIYLTKVWNSR